MAKKKTKKKGKKTNDSIIQKEIKLWSKHQELDKFNYNVSLICLFSGLAILIPLFIFVNQIILSLPPIMNLSGGSVSRMSLLIIFSSIFFLVILFFTLKKLADCKRCNRHFIIREDMIDSRLINFGVDKKKLNDEFKKCWIKKGWKWHEKNTKKIPYDFYIFNYFTYYPLLNKK